MRVVSTLVFILAICATISAQSTKSLQELKQEKFTVLQFEVIPNAKQIASLKNMGLDFTAYLGNNTYQVILSKDADLDLAKKQFSITQSNQKRAFAGIAEDIQADYIPSHARHSNSTVDIAVTFREALGQKAIAAFSQANKATIVKTVLEGQVVIFNIPAEKVKDILEEPFVHNVEFEEGEVKLLNYENKAIQGAHFVHRNSVPGMELDGSGIAIGVGDGGQLGEHIDFDNKLLFETNNYAQNFGDHGDHVCGTIASSGNLDPRQEGFAPKASLLVEKTSSIIYASKDFHDNYGMVLTNNSYGSSFDCETNGAYNYTSFTLDKQLRDLPNLMHVFAAGNNGSATCDGFPQGFSTVLKYYGAAKNVLTVGSVDEGLALASSSSKGPAKDGRIKPEICGVGVNVLSNGRDNDYLSMSGTSMAAPSVTGSMALMYQKYEQDNGEVARGDLMKAIICNSADDMGVDGPDYRYGFGLVNTYRAIKTIEEDRYHLSSVENSQKSNHLVSVPAGLNKAKFMLYWHDKEVTAGPEKALVNNLDIEIIAPDGEVILPWVLNHTSANVDEPARRGVDAINNIEQITIQNPMAGEYTIVVKGVEVPFGAQDFVVAYDFIDEQVLLTYPAGNESLVPDEKYTVSWMANRDNQNSFKLEVSLDGGNSWNLIVDEIPAAHRTYEWKTPTVISQNAKVRVSINNTNLSHVNELDFNILGKPFEVKAIPVCKETIRLTWKEDDTADEYVVYMLNNGEMEIVGETSQKHWDIEYPFEKDKAYWFSVANKMNLGSVGERTIAVPAAAKYEWECDRENDGKVVDIFGMTNGREFTSNSLSESSGFGVLIRNNGNNELSNYDVAIQVNNDVLDEKYSGTLQSGQEQKYEFNNTFDLSEVGSYTLDAWISHPLDNTNYNDSLVGQILIEQLPNAPVELPMHFDFQEAAEFYHHDQHVGLGSLTHFDFTKGDNLAESFLERMGNQSYLVLENHEVLTADQGSNAYVMTLNMTNYDMGQDINLSFDAKIFSEDLGQEGTLWLRGSDRDEWVKILDLTNEREWVSIEDINITEALKSSYYTMSTSTQLKFSLANKGSMSIDNIALRTSNKEAAVEEEPMTLANLYPNIVYNDINLEIENEDFESVQVSILNSNGQIMHEMEENLDLGKNIFTYNETSDLQSGMYFLTIKLGNHTEVKKFSKITD
jgi:hypothetical protein